MNGKAFDNFFKKSELEKEKFEENFTARFKEVLID